MDLKTVLVVDDSKVARFGLIKILQKRGLTVDCAGSGQEALDYLKTNKPDIIFMDFFMPGMDGPDAIKAIRSNGDTALIPVIMCTSKESKEDQENAKKAGVNAFIVKPATAESLDGILETISGPVSLSNEDDAQFDDFAGKQPATSNIDHDLVKKLAEATAKRVAKQVAQYVAKEHAEIIAKQTAIESAQTISTDIAKSVAAHTAQITANETARDTSANAIRTLEETLKYQWQHYLDDYVNSDEFLKVIQSISQSVASGMTAQIAKQTALEETKKLIASENQKLQLILAELLKEKMQTKFNTQKMINIAIFIILALGFGSLVVW